MNVPKMNNSNFIKEINTKLSCYDIVFKLMKLKDLAQFGKQTLALLNCTCSQQPNFVCSISAKLRKTRQSSGLTESDTCSHGECVQGRCLTCL